MGAIGARLIGAGRRPVPVSPPAHPVLLINPRSGGGKAERFGLVRECRARGIEPLVFQLGDDPSAIDGRTTVARDALAARLAVRSAVHCPRWQALGRCTSRPSSRTT